MKGTDEEKKLLDKKTVKAFIAAIVAETIAAVCILTGYFADIDFLFYFGFVILFFAIVGFMLFLAIHKKSKETFLSFIMSVFGVLAIIFLFMDYTVLTYIFMAIAAALNIITYILRIRAKNKKE